MAERGEEPRARGRAAAIGARAGAGWAAWLADQFAAGFAALAALVQAEARAARLAPWLPVAFGIGILLYFAAPAEPSLAAGGLALGILAAVTWVSRDRPLAFAVALGCAVVAAGFAAGTLRGVYVAHPVLARPTATLTLKGFVEQRDATERSERIVLRITGKEGRGGRQGAAAHTPGAAARVRAQGGRARGAEGAAAAAARAGAAGRATTTRSAPISSASAPPASCSGGPRPCRRRRRCRSTSASSPPIEGAAARHGRAHPRGAARGDGGGGERARHRRARCDPARGQRGDAHIRPLPRAVDLRAAHGAGGGRDLRAGAGRAWRCRRRWRCAGRSRNGRRSRRSAAPRSTSCSRVRRWRRNAPSS